MTIENYYKRLANVKRRSGVTDAQIAHVMHKTEAWVQKFEREQSGDVDAGTVLLYLSVIQGEYSIIGFDGAQTICPDVSAWADVVLGICEDYGISERKLERALRQNKNFLDSVFEKNKRITLNTMLRVNDYIGISDVVNVNKEVKKKEKWRIDTGPLVMGIVAIVGIPFCFIGCSPGTESDTSKSLRCILIFCCILLSYAAALYQKYLIDHQEAQEWMRGLFSFLAVFIVGPAIFIGSIYLTDGWNFWVRMLIIMPCFLLIYPAYLIFNSANHKR